MNGQNPVIIICSRRKSSRIPDKAFLRVNGMSAINHILNRLRSVSWRKIIAVPPDEVADYRRETGIFPGIEVIGGNPASPLHRMADIVSRYAPNADYIVRITNDDIVIDVPAIMEMYIQALAKNATYAYSPEIVEGAGVELIRRDVLLNAAESHKEPTEFITYCVDKSNQLIYKPRESICRPYRLTMDYPEDAVLLEVVLRELGNTATPDEICQFLDKNSGLLEINKMPELSIYTCVRNGERYIIDALESLSCLNDINTEFIIVDDKSSDGTLLKISPYLKDKRFKLICNDRNMGLASSSNIAINAARGRYVMRIDADDMIIPGNFALVWPQIKEMLKTHDIVYPGFYEMDNVGTLISTSSKNPAEKHHAGGAIMNKKFINELRFRDGLRHWDGLELKLRAEKQTGIAYNAIPTWLYRITPGSMSKDKGEERAAIKMQIMAEATGLVGDAEC